MSQPQDEQEVGLLYVKDFQCPDDHEERAILYISAIPYITVLVQD